MQELRCSWVVSIVKRFRGWQDTVNYRPIASGKYWRFKASDGRVARATFDGPEQPACSTSKGDVMSRRYQQGCLSRQSRKLARMFGFSDSVTDRPNRKAVVVNLAQFPTKTAARQACELLRSNLNRDTGSPRTVARSGLPLYRQRTVAKWLQGSQHTQGSIHPTSVRGFCLRGEHCYDRCRKRSRWKHGWVLCR